MRISDWSSDVCSSDLVAAAPWLAKAFSNPSTGKLKHAAPGTPAVCRAGQVPAAQQPWPLACCRLPSDRKAADPPGCRARKSVVEGKGVSVRVDVGGRRIIKKKKKTQCSVKVTE